MESIINAQKVVMDNLIMSGWHRPQGPPGLGEGSSGSTSSMAGTAYNAPGPQDMNKRRRLSKLLDKLAEQINNNNHYPLSQCLNLKSSSLQGKAPDDVPLDLSLKSRTRKVGNETSGYVCDICGQTFTVHDRLTKHVASQHRDKGAEVVRAYKCEICCRRFARSDMLTRHARLHSGIKPYSCSTCEQVFSRSDHLATHQRTHTGEKPYRCPTCTYTACRRDMITRHMRIHTRRSTVTEI